jgi:hypothetical protein
MTDKDDIAALKKKVEELEAKVSPPKSTFVPMSDAEWTDKMRAISERRMNFATPPSVVRDMAVLDDKLVKEIALRDARAPTGRSGMIPDSRQATGPAGGAANTTGWRDATPLGPQPGIKWVDAIAIADEVRQRKEKR